MVYMPVMAALATKAEGSGVHWPGVHTYTVLKKPGLQSESQRQGGRGKEEGRKKGREGKGKKESRE